MIGYMKHTQDRIRNNMDELLKHVRSGRRNTTGKWTDHILSYALRISILLQLSWCRRWRLSLHREAEICPRPWEEDSDDARRRPQTAAAVWAVAMTLPKNLIADPPCKVSNGKGFGGARVSYLSLWLEWKRGGKGLPVGGWGDGHLKGLTRSWNSRI